MTQAVVERRQDTYKHLDDAIRPGGLTLGNWAALAGTLLIAILFAVYASPVGEKLTLSISILIAGAPWALSHAAGGFDLSVWDGTRAIWRWARGTKHYLPGPGTALVVGYVVTSDPPRQRAVSGDHERPSTPISEAAWDH